MSRPSKVSARCVGNPSFQPEEIVNDVDKLKQTQALLTKDDLYEASRLLLGLPEHDTYTYHAMTAVKLGEVQRVVNLGGVNGLHTWYRAGDGSPVRSSKQAYVPQVRFKEKQSKSKTATVMRP